MSKKPRVVKGKFAEERRFELEPKTEAQRIYLANLHSDDIVVGIGSAGVGKTWIAAAYAAKSLLTNDIERIVISRPVVSMGKSNGFLPGDSDLKCMPWMMPMLSVFNQVMGKNAVECNIKNENIVMQPMETIRGMSWDRTIVLVDEAQNCTLEELKAISTRIGEHSQLILMGDPVQNDLKGKSGLQAFTDMCVKHHIAGFSSVQFTHHDIVRSGLVKDLVVMFEKEGV